jgi:hypothetical protein
MPFEASAAVKRGSTHYFRAALGKPLFQGLATFCAMLYDMAEVDELIYELSDLQGTYAENAAEKLIQTCSRSSEAFQYLQDRVCDVAIPERARNHIHLIIAKIRTWMSLHRAYGWAESNYAYSFGSSS